MKSLDLFIGIKAEQSLRDLVRNLSESAGSDDAGLELYPVGKKDWIAGRRFQAETKFAELRDQLNEAAQQLMSIGSHQRIRRDALRVFAVHPPVPVFRDPAEDITSSPPVPAAPEAQNGATICPNCGAEVHRFNLLFGPREKVVGCYLCRGEQK